MKTRENTFLQDVCSVVEAHLDDMDFNVEKLCKAIHMSTSQLYRKMEAVAGISAVRLIRLLRLNRAKQLLQNPQLSITVIAFNTGFGDPAYFARVFKKEFGISPLKWRHAYLRNKKSVNRKKL